MNKIIDKFKALSDETRLRVINLFIKSSKNLCVCELMDALSLPQYTVSKALNVLKSAGFFTTEKEGTWIYYKLNKDLGEIKPIINFLKSYLHSDTFMKDEERLQKRLALRENNKCVVGIISEKELLKLIKEKVEK
ncbi:metalloregulator ArsR/SmtB family transcription factor [Ignavibacteria bacterium 4148-Me]|uniref:ArsR/SmtB family transcription factor n=1 Tax=Rosettibacter primus TaxID=3111523 RepID=UPI00247F0D7E|nr:metalloregulator ArsR/SmtB family transcription factor [Ignavibacteria bacterium]